MNNFVTLDKTKLIKKNIVQIILPKILKKSKIVRKTNMTNFVIFVVKMSSDLV